MNTQAQVQAAKGPQEALVILARAFDALHIEIREALDSKPQDDWNEWGPPLSLTLQQEHAEQKRMELEEQEAFTQDPEEREALQAELRLLQDDRRTKQEVSKDGVMVTLPSVSVEKQAKRREFAIEMGVGDEFGDEIVESYAIGGPLLLYYNNRSFVMGLPADARRLMVDDVFEESPSEAQEMARDILKDMSPGVDQQTKVEQIASDAENL